MLKRPISPALPCEQYISDPSSLDSVPPRVIKRRRIDPSTSSPHGCPAEIVDTREEELAVEWDEAVSDKRLSNEEYKSANSFLHDLHILQRHRTLFSSPAAPHDYLSHQFAHPGKEDPAPFSPDDGRTTTLGIKVDRIEADSVTRRYEDTNKCVIDVPADDPLLTPHLH
jgi:hypothetical protein